MNGDALFFVWKPLAGKTWPVESMGDDDVVEVRCVLFPVARIGGILNEGKGRTMFCIPKT